MKKQIVVIHGGMTFDMRKEYLAYLKNKKVTIDNFKTRKDWKDSLEKKLGDKFEVLFPRMPNGTNARYEEWKIWFEKMLPFVKGNAVFVGHSLGGIFLAKYFAENLFSKKAKAVLLVAAPFDAEDSDESLTDFILPKSLKKFSKQTKEIYLLNSKDDPAVPFVQSEKYKKALPNAEAIIFENRGHFNQEAFPEIVKLIKTL